MMDLAGKKVLLVKLRYIGDTLSMLPVVDNLKEKVPDVSVDAMVNQGTEGPLMHHPTIDTLWVYDRKQAKKNLVSSLRYHIGLIRQLRSKKYDVVIDFTHGDRASFLCFMTGAPLRITYQNATNLSRLLMNQVIELDPSQYHIVDLQLQSLALFGLDHFDRQVRIHLSQDVKDKVEHLLLSAEMQPDVFRVAIHPGARGKLRQWPPERFSDIAKRLKETYDASILLLGGPGEEGILEDMENRLGFRAHFKSASLNLMELGAVLKRCHLFIGNDSAPGHIAAAVDCPTLTLFGPTFPHMWRPLSPQGEVIFKDVPCCGCRQVECIEPEKNCMELIDVDEVWDKIVKMVESLNR